MGLLETRIREVNSAKILRSNFRGLSVSYNYTVHRNGRIWIIWNPSTVTVLPVVFHPQFIHFQEWVVLGDFNVVRDISERISMVLPNLDDILVFNACILDCGLIDLQSSGCEYTWTSNQDGSDRVWSKLDRALVNGPWLAKFSSSSVHFPPAGISDHSPYIVTIFPEAARPRRFSFLKFWISLPGYHSLVKEAWDIPALGSATSKFLAKMRNVRTVLRQFHKCNVSGLQKRLSSLKSALDECSLALQMQPSCPVLLQQHRNTLNSYLNLKHAELSMLAQKAKADRIIHNDANTHMFYARIKERHNSQVIGTITDHHGNTRTGPAQVIKGFLSYYQHLLGNSAATHALDNSLIASGARVCSSDWAKFIMPVTNAEVKEALLSIDPNSSPGSDGFSSGFFISAWNLIESDFCSVIKEYFRTSRMPKQINTTLITLIPKKKVV
ncbi:hypothetical protein RND81_13G061800 [Saponaria officinalis]|uniref:Reverse transcriptase n=1 Tax=Saponaria officinalis TaxID=3572 RepID=A0AAW1GWK2_SAPOF